MLGIKCSPSFYKSSVREPIKFDYKRTDSSFKKELLSKEARVPL